jgi:uncharacterized transporter YbjL
MEFVRDLLLFLHIVGVAVLLAGFFAQIGKSALRITPGMFHGALLMLITGLGLVGVRESLHKNDAAEWAAIDNTKIGLKLLVLIAIFVLILLNRGKEKVGVGPWLAIGVLGITNIGIAVFWN